MPDAKPNALLSSPPRGGEPASDVGIGVAMPDLALSDIAPPAVPQAGSAEFDTWLRSHLARLHAGVLVEPVPERLLRLLDGLGE